MWFMAESITGAPPISTSTFPHSDIGLDGAHLKSPKSDPESRHQGGCGSRPGSTRGAQLACPASHEPGRESVFHVEGFASRNRCCPDITAILPAISSLQLSAFQLFPRSSTTRTAPVPISGLTRFRGGGSEVHP